MGSSVFTRTFRAFDALINVELCNSVKSIKYNMQKNMNKASDFATTGIQCLYDEVLFQNSQHISLSEAI